MTSDNAALIALLQKSDVHLCNLAASALEAAERRIKELEELIYIDRILEELIYIDHIKAIIAERDAAAAEAVALREALEDAMRTIKALHGPVAWDIYERNAPEMKRYKAALSLPASAAAQRVRWARFRGVRAVNSAIIVAGRATVDDCWKNFTEKFPALAAKLVTPNVVAQP